MSLRKVRQHALLVGAVIAGFLGLWSFVVQDSMKGTVVSAALAILLFSLNRHYSAVSGIESRARDEDHERQSESRHDEVLARFDELESRLSTPPTANDVIADIGETFLDAGLQVKQQVETAGKLFSQGRYDKAESIYIALVRIFPNRAFLLYNLAYTCQKQGKHADAQRYYKACIKVLEHESNYDN